MLLPVSIFLAACSNPGTQPAPEEEPVRTVYYSEFVKPGRAAVAEGSEDQSVSAPLELGAGENAKEEAGDAATDAAADAGQEEPEPPGPSYLDASQIGWTLGEALLEVWQRHPNIIRAQSEVEATGYELQGAKTGYYPYLSITAVEATNDDSNSTVSVVQPLWSGGKTRAEVSAARATQVAALASLNQVRLDLALEVSDSYLNVVQAQEQGATWDSYIASLEDLLGVIKRRAETGVSPSVDIQTATTRLKQAEAGLAASRSALLRNKLHLEALLHRSVGELDWPGNEYRLTKAEIDAILNESVVDVHPTGQRAIAEIAIQEARVRVAKASLFPELSAQHSAQLDQSSGDFTPDSSTQLVLRYQTTDGLRGFRGYQAVQHRLIAAKQDLLFVRRDLKDQIYSANAERAASLAQLGAQLAAAEAAVQLVDSFLRQFKVGRKAWIEVLNAYREAHETLLQLSAMRQSYWSANIRLALLGMTWRRVSYEPPETQLQLEIE